MLLMGKEYGRWLWQKYTSELEQNIFSSSNLISKLYRVLYYVLLPKDFISVLCFCCTKLKNLHASWGHLIYVVLVYDFPRNAILP